MKNADAIRGTRSRVLVVLALVGAFAWAAMMGIFPRVAAANPTTDAINSTVSLIQVLLVALLPLIILVALFSFIMGLFTGEHGVFNKLGQR